MSVWDEVVGQEAVLAQLQRAAADPRSRAQAWLLTGPPGSGRSTAARAFAAALQCEEGTGCGRCRACRSVLEGTHPDVTTVATDKLVISKDEVRALVLKAQQSPATGRHRVIVIEDADRMSAGTFNVLLKAIEEPPPLTVWMLCAPSPQDLAQTIRSRCRLVTLQLPPPAVVADLLVRRDGVEPELAERAARAAQGHIGLALRFATVPGLLDAREERGRRLLGLRGVGDAVLLAQQIVEEATTEAKEHAETLAAEEKEAFARSAGLDGRTVPPALRGQLRQLEEDAKRRQVRLARDVLERSLLDADSVLRDVLRTQIKAGEELTNPALRPEIEAVAGAGRGEDTLQLVEAVQEARTRIAANVPPLLAIEALLGRVAVTLR